MRKQAPVIRIGACFCNESLLIQNMQQNVKKVSFLKVGFVQKNIRKVIDKRGGMP